MSWAGMVGAATASSLPTGRRAAGWAAVVSAAMAGSWWGWRVLPYWVPHRGFPPAPTGAGEALGLAQGESRLSSPPWVLLALLAPQNRRGAGAGRGPVHSPAAHIGWTQTFLANGAAGIHSDRFSKCLLHLGTSRFNPWKGPGLGPGGALFAVFVFVPPLVYLRGRTKLWP